MCAATGTSLDHWDMRTGRNPAGDLHNLHQSLDHWDMRTGRNRTRYHATTFPSLDYFFMRTGPTSSDQQPPHAAV